MCELELPRATTRALTAGALGVDVYVCTTILLQNSAVDCEVVVRSQNVDVTL